MLTLNIVSGNNILTTVFFIGKMKSARLFYVLALIYLVIYESTSGSESDKILSLGAEPFVATMDKRFSGRNFFCLFG